MKKGLTNSFFFYIISQDALDAWKGNANEKIKYK